MSQSGPNDERGYADYGPPEREEEHRALLPSRIKQLKISPVPEPQHRQCCNYRRPLKPYLVPLVSFLGGGSAVLLVQLLQANYPFPFHRSTTTSRPDFLTAANGEGEFAPPYIGSKEIHNYPTSPTNDFPSLFPTEVGYPGPRGTGAEPALIQTTPVYPNNLVRRCSSGPGQTPKTRQTSREREEEAISTCSGRGVTSLPGIPSTTVHLVSPSARDPRRSRN